MSEPLILETRGERVCPACGSPMTCIEQGTHDKRGPFEVWECAAKRTPGGSFDATAHQKMGAKLGLVRLELRDYEKAAARRARLLSTAPDPKHHTTCPKNAGLPGRCQCARGSAYTALRKLNRRAAAAEDGS